MPLSYAGVNLPVLDSETARLMGQYIDPADLYPWADTLTGKNRVAWTIQGSPVWKRKVKIGSLYWPTGASRWAVGYFVADSNTLADIRKAVYPSSGYTSASLVLDDGTNSVTAKNMWMLPPHPVFTQAGDNGLWLLTLVDQRYWFWWVNSGTIATSSWSTLYSSIASALGVTITPDAINSAYLSTSLAIYDERIPPLLDSVAYNVGQRVVFGLDGTIKADGYTTNNTAYTANLNKTYPPLAGGQFLASPSQSPNDTPGLFPKTIKIGFQTATRTSSSSSYANQAGYTEFSVNYTSLGLPATTTNGNTRSFRTTGYLGITGGVHDNDTECQNLVNQFAKDWYQFQTSAADLVYAGVVPWNPEGLSDSIEWTYRNDIVCTRIQRPAFNDPVEELLSQTSVTVPPGGGGGGSSLTLKNGSTVVDSACTVLNEDDRAIITWANTSTNNDKPVVADASITQAGAVNTTTQSYAGLKTFTMGVIVTTTEAVGQYITIGATSSHSSSSYIEVVSSTPYAPSIPNSDEILIWQWNSAAAAYASSISEVGATGSVAWYVTDFSVSADATATSQALIRFIPAKGGVNTIGPNNPTTAAICFVGGDGGVPNLGLGGHSSVGSMTYTGQTGTDYAGNTITSGLVTGLGSGPSVIDGGTWT